jgi:hypothetical protein
MFLVIVCVLSISLIEFMIDCCLIFASNFSFFSTICSLRTRSMISFKYILEI